ncbi:MAG: pyrroline-5-carboxylate reductase [Pelagibacterales bacterium]|nr:pyrroline-5-carboxylate reductase [Pelagibacterales bacterium]
MKIKNIFFLGCGKMGSIIANNLVNESKFKNNQITVLKKTNNNQSFNFKYIKSSQDLDQKYKADLVFIAIKPQDSEEVLHNFMKEQIFHKETIFVSILAGKKIAFFEKILGKDKKIIRSMPNLPIQDSQGIFPYLCNKNINKSEKLNLHKIFSKFGHAFDLQNEKLFDATTAIFGSGPAYIFHLQEIFTKIAIKLGLDNEESAEIVKTLFLGTSLMSCNSDLNFAELKKSVTSKGGTTEAALEILENKKSLENLFEKAIEAAKTKSEILSQ